MSKKIISVKPTKNPCKFIFETEMSADELKKYVHEWFDDRACNVYIDSIKPSGLWANKLFVNVSFDQQHELPGHALGELRRLMNDFNKNIESEESEAEDLNTNDGEYKVMYEFVGSNYEWKTDNRFGNKCLADMFIEAAEKVVDGIFTFHGFKCRNLIVEDPSGKQIWPKSLWSIHCKSIQTNHDHDLMNTRDYAEKLVAYLKTGPRHAQLLDLKKNMVINAYADSIKVFNEKNEQVWPKENKSFWHVEVKRQAIIGDNKFDLLPCMGLDLLDQLLADKDIVYFHDVNDYAYKCLASSILRLWNGEKTFWSHEDKKPDTNFSAPSLLSRIYETN